MSLAGYACFMRRVGVVVAVFIVATVLIIAGLIVAMSNGSSQKVGFDSSDLKAPTISYVPYSNGSVPTPYLLTKPSYDVTMAWEITADIYAGYGGVLNLTVRNTNPTGKILVYAFGLEWKGGAAYERNCSVTISHGSEAELGLLIFGAPTASNAEYRLFLRLAASNPTGTGWYDIGVLPQDDWNSVTIQPLSSAVDYSVSENLAPYYNRVNERVGYSAVQSVVSVIKAKYPGNYSVLQIAAAYEWEIRNIAYKLDSSGDYWQSASETLELRTGDCEDHAILIASIIGGLGGNARVNVIQDHAFPTVFVATNAADLAKVKVALASFYGVDVSSFKMAYLHDEVGYWLVIDTTGFPYAGGIPAKSAPTSANGNWTVLSNYIYTIDATGATVSGGFLGIL
ncbi:MAG TPA: hypothetical protein VHS28_10855 [Chloroflexota bacterium]|nr:hypothetical protein [Chloroflexota bacterium]